MKPLSAVLLFITASALAQQPTTTTLIADHNPSNTHMATSLVATVHPYDDANLRSPTPGKVTFIDQNNGNSIVLGVVSADYGSCCTWRIKVGSFNTFGVWIGFTPGVHEIYALYSGTADFAPSFGYIKQDIEDVSIWWDPRFPPVFPPIYVGQDSAARRFSIYNKSAAPVTVHNLIVEGDFVVTSNKCANGVQPNSHCDVWVSFQPFGVGVNEITKDGWVGRVGKLTFITNVGNMILPLSGIAAEGALIN